MDVSDNSKQISILGCGWLGKITAKHLISDGYTVLGSYHTEAEVSGLKECGIKPVYIELLEQSISCEDKSFWDSDVLIMAIPPKRSDDVERIYTNRYSQILELVKKGRTRKVIFISSTSVYPENGREVNEQNICVPTSLAGKAVLKVEQMFLQDKVLGALVVRSGGLIGVGRLPGGFALKTGFKLRGNVPVNLVFGEDVGRAINFLINNNQWNQVFNVVAPLHPQRADLYAKAAKLQGVKAPGIAQMEKNKEFKIVSSQKLIDAGFKFDNPDLISGLDALYKS